MKTLLIDNYDSYTFNLYQIIAEINGESPLVMQNDRLNWQELEQLEFDNAVISPGPGHPANQRDFGICDRLLRELEKPILGVCLGHQGIGYVFGGIVTHAPEVRHGRNSQIYHQESDLFNAIPNPFSAVRYHSLIIDKYSLPKCLEMIAWTDDSLIMGLRHRHKPIFGVQFHPESICTEYGKQILDNFKTLTSSFQKNKNLSKTTCKIKYISTSQSNKIPPKSPQITSPSKPKTDFQVFFKKLDFLPNSEQVFVHFYSNSPYAFWLDSSQVEEGLSRFSFMGSDRGRHSLRISYNCRDLEITQNNLVTHQNISIFKYLQEELDRQFCKTEDLPFNFNCGFVGYFGYELKVECGAESAHSFELPDAAFLLATQMLAFDHQEKNTYLLYLGKAQEAQEAEIWFNTIENALETMPPLAAIAPVNHPEPVLFRLSRDRQTYLKNIEQCLQEIHNGESYEICLTNRLYTNTTPDPLAFYRHLRQRNPAPYSGFLKFGNYTIVCSSPERFLQIDRDGWVETKPIKGTSPRGQTLTEDRQIRENLSNSEKDRAENLMVLDLLRNDLGRTCDVGSIHVPKLMQVETYATVHQLVSTIRGHLRADLKVTDCIRAAFPGGSMTGAPKLRTMEIIDRLEGEARGIYSGAIGFLGLNGTADLNIVIRTAILTPTETSIGVGGGITAMSDPEMEFQETLLKAEALIHALVQTLYGEEVNNWYKEICTAARNENFLFSRNYYCALERVE
ncbi:aminodeoxychorismate synthase component I [Spirulina sp. 06S082]|uniref:aminodeoxychorismate synthase component I n=1 Tax=Spirulina sp. 06S082 TaxID=3110248 RepID=UPI002B1F2FED|nr:aminodeoxychorismate synthase component I [Spirulina sp. 06S082]MEA5469154.1 aminodeoxychorismate synthase component I [Spirulina sp. 06S082]